MLIRAPRPNIPRFSFRAYLHRKCWPDYACQDCVGAGRDFGVCYCAYHEGVAPGVGPDKRIILLRKVYKKMFGSA